MDKRTKDEMLETLQLFGVMEKDREACLQDLISEFNDYRRRERQSEMERKEIEARLRKPNIPTTRFSAEVIIRTRNALKDAASGNRDFTMTDLDLVCDMLDELVKFNHNYNS